MPTGWIRNLYLLAAVLFSAKAFSQPAGRQILHDHIPPAAKLLSPTGRMAGNARLQLAIGLPLRNQAALAEQLQQIYNPASTNYHHYLTPQEFTALYGPTETDYQTLIHFAETNGWTVVGTHPNRVVLDVSGRVTDIERGLHVTMENYRHPTEARDFHAPDVEPSLDLVLPLLHISGLDNYSLPHPNVKVQPLDQTGQLTANATPRAGSGSSGSYRGSDFRAAYVPGTALTGAGQSVGLLQYDGYYSNDINSYISQAGISTSVVLSNILINGGPINPSGNNVEVALDIEMVLSMSPSVSKIYVYEGTNGVTPWATILSRMANDNLSRQLSCSWGGGGPDATSEAIFQQMALQGQSFFNATGDSDAFTTAIAFPSDSTNITQVGGTTLSTIGPAGAYVSETVWNRNNGVGSSGGTSTVFPIPNWQQPVAMTANLGSTTYRNVPDVALTGENVYIVYNNGIPGIAGGTSCAAPLWAGFMALVNEQAAASGRPSAGFINPLVYAIGRGGNYTANFHDTTVGNNFSTTSPAKFPAVTGFDLCTGWGTPTGTNLINTFTIGAPSVLASGSTLITEGCAPTNGAIDPDETVTVNFALQNIGSLNTTNLVATLLATNGVLAPSGPQTFGALSTNGTLVSKSFTFTSTGACGTLISPTFQLQDGLANLGQTSLNIPLGALTVTSPLTQNFDSVIAPALPAGWTTTNSGSQALWITSTTANNTAPNAAFTAGASTAGVNELVSPAINILSPTAQLTFRNNYNLQNTSSTRNDGGVLEIKIGTNAFADILASGGSFVSGGYIRTLGTTRSNPLGGRSAWTGNSGGFTNTTVNLPATAAGQTIQLKWRCGTDSSTPSTGWYIDTIVIADNYYACCSGISPNADLALGQVATPALTNIGGRFTFTLNITNLGPATATNTFVTNTLSAGLSFISATPAASFTNGNTLTFSPGSLASNARTNITIIAAATSAGLRTNTATVSSDTTDPVAGNNSASNTVTVNAFPVISALSNVTNNEDTVVGPIAFTVSDAETAATSLTVTAGSTNTTLLPNPNITLGGSGTNRTITLNPITNQFGATFVTLTVSDGVAAASNSFNYIVNPVNDAPVLAPISNRTIVELSTLTFTNNATDVDIPTNTLTYSMISAPTNATLTPNTGVFTWTPTEAQGPMTTNISIIVTDNGSPSLSATQTFTVTVLESNLPPVLAAISNRTIFELTTLVFTNLATDSDIPTNTLTYSMLNAPTNATVTPNTGVFTWTPTEAQGPSTTNISIIVTDNGSPSLSATQTFTVTVLESNLPPVLDAISNQVIYETVMLVLTNSASDPDLPPNNLTFSLTTNAPVGAAINPTNGVFTWEPDEAQGPGTNQIVVIVTDDGTPSLSATQSFTVVVLESNLPPTLTAISNRTIAPGSTLTVQAVATDPDRPANILTYSLDTGSPTNADINSTNGLLIWPTTTNDAGITHSFTIRVTDDGLPPLNDAKTFSVHVDALPISLRSLTQSNTVLTVTWNATTGLTYQLQVKDNLDDSNWVDTNSITATNPVTTLDLPANPEHRFYRIILP